jgi:transglutaminase-like putative cysteine protease
MPERRSPNDAGPDRRRLVFVLCCIVAVAAGGVLVATVSSDSLAGSPIDSALPGEDISSGSANITRDGFAGSLGSAPGLGSLAPGAQTGAGGDIGFDNDTFASLDNDVHFTAESSSPTYWRTAAYRSYTGTGWERPAETESYDPPLNSDGFEQVEYNVTLNRPATAVPAPWQPTTLGGLDEGTLEVTSEGSVTSTEILSNGTTFTGVSGVPQTDPGVLRNADDRIPPEIEPYTELPEDVPPRLDVQANNVVGGADGRYEAAVAIQEWLRDGKEYSLDAFRESDQVADTFAFEMEAGYCEYFATTMAVMLRTQDIPTRYALGYSSGQQVEDGVYRVREMNAHAWVEVHFPEVGWVQFDPTPGGPRLQAQQEALDGEYNVTDPGSPGETLDLDESDETNNTDGWNVAFEPTPVPGQQVEATVTVDGQAVENATVLFDGTPVGTTGGDGTVTATVPEGETFRVRVVGPSEIVGVPAENATLAAGATLPGPDRLAAGVTLGQAGEGAENRTVIDEVVNIRTEATLELGGRVRPGEKLGVAVLVGDDPVANATVSVGGEARGQTGGAGRVTVTMPPEAGSVTLTAERGPISGERTVDVPAFEMTAESEWPLALPFAPTTVEATYGDEPAAGVPVQVNGERVSATGPDGTTTVTLPLAGSAEIVAVGGTTAGTTIDGLLWRLLLVLVPAGALVAGGVLLVGRARSAPGRPGPLGRLRQGVSGLGGLFTRLLVVGSGRGESTVGTASTRLDGLLRFVLAALGVERPSPGPTRGTDGLVTVGHTDTDPVSDEQATVRAAWDRFLDHVSAPAATHTPGELATHAIEDDNLPADAVRTLRDSFRAVEYGSRPAEPDRVRAAVRTIERAGGGDDG